MKRKFIVLGLITLLTTVFINGCSTSNGINTMPKNEEEAMNMPIYVTYDMIKDIESLKISDGTIQVLDCLITLPIKFSELKDKTGLKINDTFTREVTNDTILQPGESIKIYLTSNDADIISVVVENDDEKLLKKLPDCIITEFDISKTTSKDLNNSLSGLIYMLCGTTYGQNIESYQTTLDKLEINPVHTHFENTDLLNYVDGNYSFSIFYDTESKMITELNFKIYKAK